jgi:prepilin-type N-terminal cleavage/methylation domain-containing protein
LNKKGFTLVEVLLAIVILGYTSVFLFRAFFTSLYAMDYSLIRVELINDMNNRLAKEKLIFLNGDMRIPLNRQKEIDILHNRMKLTMHVDKVLEDGSLVKGDISYQWKEGKRVISEKRDFFWKTKAEKKFYEK